MRDMGVLMLSECWSDEKRFRIKMIISEGEILDE